MLENGDAQRAGRALPHAGRPARRLALSADHDRARAGTSRRPRGGGDCTSIARRRPRLPRSCRWRWTKQANWPCSVSAAIPTASMPPCRGCAICSARANAAEAVRASLRCWPSAIPGSADVEVLSGDVALARGDAAGALAFLFLGRPDPPFVHAGHQDGRGPADRRARCRCAGAGDRLSHAASAGRRGGRIPRPS